MYGEKIKMIRELRNFSQDYVAESLGIKQNSYSKIETNQTKLTAETLQKLSEIFQVSPMDIMNHQPAIINFQPNQGTQQSIGYIETFVSSQKELIDKLIETKNKETDSLKEIVNGLKEVISSLKK